MDAKQITDKISVSVQLTADDIKAAQKAGFRSIICNRPDGEGADQPTFAEIEKAAHAVGLETRYLPVVAGKVQDADADAFGAAMRELPKPVLSYCRTGTRSATLWSLSQANKLPLADILSATKAAGYDIIVTDP